MTTAETVRRLLVDAAGEPLCNSCLAFASSASLAEMQQLTEEILTNVNFKRGEGCASITYAAVCAHCRRAVLPGDDALVLDADIIHAVCFRALSSDETRISRRLSPQTRRLIEGARSQMRSESRPLDATSG